MQDTAHFPLRSILTQDKRQCPLEPNLGGWTCDGCECALSLRRPLLGLTTNLTLSCHGHSWLTLSQQARP